MKYFLIIIIFPVLIIACRKNKIHYNITCNNPTNDINISRELIIGKWTWVSKLYREQLTGQLILKTPQSEGYTRQMFASNSVLEYFKNYTFKQKYSYEFTIERAITNYPDDTTNVLVFKDYNTGQRSNYVHYKICNDTLTLNFQILSSFKGIEKWAKNK